MTMDAKGHAYYQSLLFQPQPVSSFDAPIVFSASTDDGHGLHQHPYEGIDSRFEMFNSCYSSPLNCGQPMPETPLRQYMQCPDEQALSIYNDHNSFSGCMGSLSPVPVDMAWGRQHPSEHSAHSRTVSRATSFTSNSSSWSSCPRSDLSRSDVSRSASPNASEMARWGEQQEQGTWRCAYPGCTSKSVFRRGCDLRKHYRRHTKSLYCRHAGCKQSSEGGFSSEKDRARHEAKHNPQIMCEWDGCSRVFSRVDNMVCLCRDLLLQTPTDFPVERSRKENTPSQASKVSAFWEISTNYTKTTTGVE